MSEPEAMFAEAVVARFPSIEQVRFTNSGSEANIMALLTARHATGRSASSCSTHGYHGGPLYFGPGGGRCSCRSTGSCCRTTTWPPSRPSSRTHGDDGSPPCSSSRCSAPAAASPAIPEFLAALRSAHAAEHGAVLDLRRGDDVAPRRRAAPRSCSGITPDLTTLGKYLAGGLSFGAFGGRRDLMAAYDPARGGLTHGGTFNNNAFTMAVGAAVHESLIDADDAAAVNERGDRLRDGLDARFDVVAAAVHAPPAGVR